MPSFSFQERRGLTLIEVVASLMLLSSLLVSAMLAFGAHTRQLEMARRQLQATKLLDRQINEWYAKLGRIPRNERGSFREGSELHWETRPVRGLDLAGTPVEIIRIEVRDARPRSTTMPLVMVELPERRRGNSPAPRS